MDNLIKEMIDQITHNCGEHKSVTLEEYIMIFKQKGYEQSDIEKAFSQAMIKLGNVPSEYYD